MKKISRIFLCLLMLCYLAVPALAAEPPEFITKTLPEGTVDAPYSVQLETTDPNATFDLYNNEKENNFNKTGLVLTLDGKIEGTPVKAGIYTFTVSATGEGGKRYMTYTLTVKEAPEEPTQETTLPEETTAPAEETEPSAKPTDPAPVTSDKDSEGGFPWWGIALIAVAAVGAGTGIVLLTRKK